MDFGVGIASGVDGWKVAQRAEALGFTHAWLVLHKGHFTRPRPEEERFLTATLMRDLTTTGTADEVVERVRGLAVAGYRQLTVCLAPGHEGAIEDWARVLERV